MAADAPSPAPDAIGLPARVVLDTNVLISAALLSRSLLAQLLRQVLVQSRLVFSQATLTELETRLWKPKFDRYISLEARKAILRDARAAALWVDMAADLQARRWSRDPDDDAFIRTALAAQSPWLVTGDDDLLRVPAMAELRIATPAQALAAWRAA